MEEKKILLGCSSDLELLDADAEAVLWINRYNMNKVKKLGVYKDDVNQLVMPEFWQTQEEFCNATDYVIKVYKVVIADLAGQLDVIHNSCFGERGWNIILREWLRIYIEGFFDKYARIKYAVRHYPDLYIKTNDIWYIPRDGSLRDNEILQTQQFTDAYKHVYFANKTVDEGNEKYEIMQSLTSDKIQDSNKRGIKCEAVKILKKLICTKEVTLYLSSRYLALSKTTLELLSRGRIQRIEMSDEITPQNSVLINMRRKLKRNADYKDEFINLVYDCLWRHIPMKFLEDFRDYYEAYRNLKLIIPKIIVDSIMIYHNMLFKIFVAEAIGHNCKLEIIQHGGDYCIEKYTGIWEIEISDKFYTWGNGFVKNRYTNLQAMPCPKTLSVKQKRKKDQRKILFVEYVNYPYVPRFDELHAMKMEEFYRQEEVFFQSLEPNSRDLLEVRCHHADQWWNRKKVLVEKFPWMRLDEKPSYYASMIEARLVVTNKIGTTCMETISCDIPTILFFSDEFFVPDENAVEILNELRRVQVLHDSPEAAAALINKIVGNVGKWWHEKERKKVVNKFREMYASRGWFSELKWIRELLKESKSG